MAALTRVFAAVGLGPAERLAVAAWIDANRVPGRVTPPENLHVTVRWFGDLDEVVYDRLGAAIDEADLPGPFVMRLEEAGAFPRPSKATVAWVHPVAPALDRLRGGVDDAADSAGIPEEDRPFRPHLTVSRIRPELDLRSWVDATPPVGVVVHVDRLVLLRSRLGGGLPRYELLEEFAL